MRLVASDRLGAAGGSVDIFSHMFFGGIDVQAVEQCLILPPGLQCEDDKLGSAMCGCFFVSNSASTTVSCDDISQRLKLCRGSPSRGPSTWVSGLDEAAVRIQQDFNDDDELNSTVSDRFSISSSASTTVSCDDIGQLDFCRGRASKMRSTCGSEIEQAPARIQRAREDDELSSTVSDRCSVSSSMSTTVGCDDIIEGIEFSKGRASQMPSTWESRMEEAQMRMTGGQMAPPTMCLPPSRAIVTGKCGMDCSKDASLFRRLWIMFLCYVYSWLQSVGDQVHKFMQEESPPLFLSSHDLEISNV
jgi:hypothetical protein